MLLTILDSLLTVTTIRVLGISHSQAGDLLLWLPKNPALLSDLDMLLCLLVLDGC